MKGKRLTRRGFLGAASASVGLLPWRVSGGGEPATASQTSSAEIRHIRAVEFRTKDGKQRGWYVEIATTGGVTGRAGPLLNKQAVQVEKLSGRLRELLVGRDPVREKGLEGETIWESLYPGRFKSYLKGRDPLTGRTVWGTRRNERHTSTGYVILAISAVDNALWDLRGKVLKTPLYRLLGGRRERLPAYVSVFAPNPADARRQGRALYDRGFIRQKWFLPNGPSDGARGRRENVELVRVLREDLGPKAVLMFDGFRKAKQEGDVNYAVSLARDVLPYNPLWLEEPIGPEDIEGYARIKGETGIPLATGEHTYTRWNVKPFLERKILDFVQSDPEWCGGISELLSICALAKQYKHVKVVPHGHHVLAASHVVASQSEQLCPMMEFGLGWARNHQLLQTRILEPEAGYFQLPNEPGLGPDVDEPRLSRG